MRTASDNLIPVSLELGGKSPCIIFPDANLDVAVGVTQMGTFSNAGQICCASTRIFVHESVYDEFVEKTVAATKQRKVGDNLGTEPVDQGISIFDLLNRLKIDHKDFREQFQNITSGPQQNKEQFQKVLSYLKLGRDEGADVLCGGNRMFDEGNFGIFCTIYLPIIFPQTFCWMDYVNSGEHGVWKCQR